MAGAMEYNFVVKKPAFIDAKGLDQMWTSFCEQISPTNKIVAIDKPSFLVLSDEQRGVLMYKYKLAVPGEIEIINDKSYDLVFIGPTRILSVYRAILRSPQGFAYLKSIAAPIKLQRESQKLYRRPEYTTATTTVFPGQVVQGNNQVVTINHPPATLTVYGPQAQAPGGQKKVKVSRPPNMWIIYRSANHAIVKAANPGLSNNEISSIISRMWSDESVAVRKHYSQLAELAKLQHQKEFPDYQFTPRKTAAIKRRNRHGVAEAPIIQPEPSFAQASSDEVFTTINGSLNRVDNSVSLLGGVDATYYQEE
ncbi:hypothetical protein EG329_007232 [Mollisiaceae sp. DMI_Dod_QoI]|nr:hypothetical protein EG329_007232 [Helotiales sp. DMI_Dod_QoI]